ncbi:MAG: phosphoribosylanthranilate isomerase [Planctomycetota bacterium]|nr:phosphoribosylanthranilate isomerase [Planctomycetota bacterium]
MFRIKICGVGNLQDVEVVVSSGADAIGFNFVPASCRYVDPAQVGEFVQAAGDLACVGVFVNEPIASIRRIERQAGLSHLQMHGEERIADLALLDGMRVLKAWRVQGSDLSELRTWLQGMSAYQWRPAAILLDAFSPGSHGGTGRALPWSDIQLIDGRLEGIPVLLAGGLTPENVAQAIRTTRPAGVDVASGVESSPGQKDHGKIRHFVQSALDAFQSLEQ